MAATTTTMTSAVDDQGGRLRLADLAERLVWTFVPPSPRPLVSPPPAEAAGVEMSLSTLDAAFVAGTSAVVNFLTVVARWRLSVLPDPGMGLHRNQGRPVEAAPPMGRI